MPYSNHGESEIPEIEVQPLQPPVASPHADPADSVPRLQEPVLGQAEGAQDPQGPAGPQARVITEPPRIARTADEVQFAHDAVLGALFADLYVDMCGPDDDEQNVFEQMKANADVLCWLLGHKHNTIFEQNLITIQEVAKARDIKMVDLLTGKVQP